METPSLPAVFATSLHVTMRRHCYCNLAEVDAEALWLQRHIEGSPQRCPVQALALAWSLHHGRAASVPCS